MNSNGSKVGVSRRNFLSGFFAMGLGAAAMGLTGCASPRSFADEVAQTTIDGGEYDIVVVGSGGAAARENARCRRQHLLCRGRHECLLYTLSERSRH